MIFLHSLHIDYEPSIYIFGRYKNVWLGIEAAGGDNWRWDDGSDVTFPLPWAYNEPKSEKDIIVDEFGFWSVASGGASAKAYTLCETEVEGTIMNMKCRDRYSSDWSLWVIPMGVCKKDVTPLLTHWNYAFLALNHRYNLSREDKIEIVNSIQFNSILLLYQQ